MLLEMESRIFDLDIQLISDAVLSIIAVFSLFPFFLFILGFSVIGIKFLIKKLREK